MTKSPIKWAGGKTRVMPQLLMQLPKADCLIEPFVGSGTVFMNTEYRRYILCDSNRALINFFRVLTSNTERLIDTARGMFWVAITKSSITSDVRYLTPCSGAIRARLILLYFMPLCFCI